MLHTDSTYPGFVSKQLPTAVCRGIDSPAKKRNTMDSTDQLVDIMGFKDNNSSVAGTMDFDQIGHSDSSQSQCQQICCQEYRKCSAQNGVRYGAVPLSPIKLFTGDSTYWEQVPDIIQAHQLIRQSGLPNVLGLRIPVHTQLNVNKWSSYLSDYYDQQLPDLIEFGFPLDFDRI